MEIATGRIDHLKIITVDAKDMAEVVEDMGVGIIHLEVGESAALLAVDPGAVVSAEIEVTVEAPDAVDRGVAGVAVVNLPVTTGAQ